MLAIAAAVAFFLAFFGVSPGGFDLVPLGLAFVALHLAFGSYLPWLRRS